MNRSIVIAILTVFLQSPFIASAAAKEPWEGNSLGKDHSVPIPWTTLKTSGSKVSCWGRTLEFEGHALPVQITTQNTPLLVSPILLRAEIDKDSWETSSPGKGKFTTQKPDRVVWEGECTVAGIPVKTVVEHEFDGFTWLTLKFRPSAQVKIRRLSLDLPLREDVAKFYSKEFQGYAPNLLLDMWGKVKSRKLRMQDFSMANEEIGIGVFQEGKRGWWLERKDRQLEWIKEDGQVLVRFNLVDLFVPQALESERTISLGWTALPVKPMRPDARRFVVVTGNPLGDDQTNYYNRKIAKSGLTMVGIQWPQHLPDSQVAEMVKTNEMARLNCNLITVPQPNDPGAYKKFVLACHQEAPCKMTIYTVGNEHFIPDPVFYRHLEEWSARPITVTTEELRKLKETEGWHTVPVCGWARAFADYKVWYMTHWFKELGLDGYYYDNQCFEPCENPKHPEHQFVDEKGNRIVVRPLLAYRDLYKRVYKGIKNIKPDSIIVGHGCNVAYPFVDIAIGGEAIQKLAGDTDYYTAFLTTEDCRGLIYNGHQMGIPFLWLPEYGGKYYCGPESVKATRAMLSLLWLTDSCYWLAWSHIGVLAADAQVRGQFKIWEAEWLPFWKQDVVQVDKEGISVAVYKKAKSALLVVSNPTKTPQETVTLSVNVGDLFPGVRVVADKIVATDVEYPAYMDLGFKAEDLKTQYRMTDKPLETKPLVAVEKVYLDVKLGIAAQDLRIIQLELP